MCFGARWLSSFALCLIVLDLVVLYCMILFWAVCFSWFPIGVWFGCGFLCVFVSLGLVFCCALMVRLGCLWFMLFVVRIGCCLPCLFICVLLVCGFGVWLFGCCLGYCCFDFGFWLVVTFAQVGVLCLCWANCRLCCLVLFCL